MAQSDFDIANLALIKTGDTKGLIGSLADNTNQARVLNLLYASKRDALLRSFKWPWAQRRAYPSQLGGPLWNSATPYAQGAYVNYVPSSSKVVNLPEIVDSFVYLSLSANNVGNAPDSSPTQWRQISRAAWAYCFTLPGDVILVHGLYPSNLRNPREDLKIPFELGYEPAPGPGTLLFTDTGWPWDPSPNFGVDGSSVSIELMYTARVTDVAQYPEDFVDALAWDIAAELCLALLKDAGKAKQCADAARVARGIAVAAAKLSEHKEPEPAPSWIAARHTRRRGSR